MASSSFDLTFKVKNLFFDRAAIKAMMDGRTAAALNKAGGWIKVTAQRSMRYVTSLGSQQGQVLAGNRKKLYQPLPSAPGDPPHAIRGHSYIRDFLFYGYDPDRRSVVIGPVRLSGMKSNVPALHEHGGSQTLRARKAIVHRPGQSGPIRIGGRPGMGSHTVYNARGWPVLVTYGRLWTASQAAASNRIEIELATTSGGVKPGETYIARYFPRPFMGPALAKAQSSLPKFWAAGIQSAASGAA